MKRKTSITLNEETYKKLKDISKMSGISIARFIEKSVDYVLDNHLEKDIFFPSDNNKKSKETKDESKDFKLKL